MEIGYVLISKSYMGKYSHITKTYTYAKDYLFYGKTWKCLVVINAKRDEIFEIKIPNCNEIYLNHKDLDQLDSVYREVNWEVESALNPITDISEEELVDPFLSDRDIGENNGTR